MNSSDEGVKYNNVKFNNTSIIKDDTYIEIYWCQQCISKAIKVKIRCFVNYYWVGVEEGGRYIDHDFRKISFNSV